MKYFAFILMIFVLFSCQQKSASLFSPDGNLKVDVWVDEISNLNYLVTFENEKVIAPSFIGFELEDGTELGSDVKIISVSQTEANKSWQPVYGERSEILDNYRELTLLLQETVDPNRKFEITFRLFNEGVAFKTTFLPDENMQTLQIKQELSEFTFVENYPAWVSSRAQSEISKKEINSIKEPVERPLVVEAGSNFLALGEAKLINFSRMKFISGEKNNTLTATLHNEAKVSLPYSTPWRTILIGKTAGELLENNFILENLNDECAIKDVSWIKPGKVIREVTLTTQGGLACVDFAAENGLQYVEFDAGWYGPENDDNSDATTITVDPKRSPGPLDLHKIIEYASSKNIGILVYVNRRALEKQIDTILPLYKSWGIKGVKYGFVQVGSQEWTAWLHEAVKKAADNQLMVDIHDEYRPTGFSRTYPNLMTQEGIRGDEETPTNEHTLKTLFTRMLAGAGDNTNCYYAPRVQEKMGGNVSQLAKAVMLYSPWQFLYWYDRPQGSPGKKGGAGSSDGFIQNHAELEFFKILPTVWDETKVLEGEIGKYATIVRRSGDNWFLGALTGENGRSLSLKTTFLQPDKNYEATIYSFDPNSTSTTKVNIEKQNVNTNSNLMFSIAENSGLAISFELK